MVLLELGLELREPLALPLLLLGRLAPELLPEVPLELCELLAPELDEALLWPELPLPPEEVLLPELPLLPPERELDDPPLEEPALEEAEPEDPELRTKFSRGISRRGS